MTTDGSKLIYSDGTSTIYFLNPDTMQSERKITVTWDGREVGVSHSKILDNKMLLRQFIVNGVYMLLNHLYEGNIFQFLNELEYIHGEIWANVWYTQRILRIDPNTGWKSPP